MMAMSRLGVVVIGRNEGERLRRCIRSALRATSRLVYVDSGSSDGSVQWVAEQGLPVMALDTSIPFSAARARNEGFRELRRLFSGIEFVQFVDGDCELAAGWLGRAVAELQGRPEAAIVCGRLRERYPDVSPYQRLADMEWNVSVGEVDTCGGIHMIRIEAFEDVGGFDASLIAGEEPEMCLRLQRKRWKIIRLSDPMAWHEADMYRFGQWWKRSLRSGYACAEGFWRHGRGSERYCVRSLMSIVFWGMVLPVLAVSAAWPTGGWSLLGFGLYPVQWWRIRRRCVRARSAEDARLYATFTLVGKFAQIVGVGRFVTHGLFRGRRQIIEYKGATEDSTAALDQMPALRQQR